MSAFRTSLRLAAATLCLGFAAGGHAQEKTEYKGTPEVKLDVCQGQVKVLSQAQNAKGVDLSVEVSIKGCDGACIGSVEYQLLFTADDGREIQWHMSDGWEWRKVDAPFTLQLHQGAPANAKLKEVKSMKLGRCSCSTVSRSSESAPQPTDFKPIGDTVR